MADPETSIVKKTVHHVIFPRSGEQIQHKDTEENFLVCNLCKASREAMSETTPASIYNIIHNKGCKYYRLPWEDEECIERLESHINNLGGLTEDEKKTLQKAIEIIKRN